MREAQDNNFTITLRSNQFSDQTCKIDCTNCYDKFITVFYEDGVLEMIR